MGRVVAIAGFGQGDANVLYRYAVGLTGKEHANVLYLGTAGSDAEANVASATRRFESLGCGMRALCLITKTYTDAEIDEHLAWADMIFVGGGDTISMMRVWKEHGLDAKLKEVYRNDAAVLSGVLLLFGVYRNRRLLTGRTLPDKSYWGGFAFIVVVGLLLRLILCALFRGHDSDMGCFIAWGQDIAHNGARQFY